MAPRSWREECQSAPIVFTAWVESNRLSSANEQTGVSTLRLIGAVRHPPLVALPERITIDRFIPINQNRPSQAYLIFADINKDKLDPYRGIPIERPDVAREYLRGMLGLNPAEDQKRIEFAFSHLQSSEPEVVRDSFVELEKTATEDLIRFGAKLDRDKVKQMLKRRDIRGNQYATLVVLLAACGTTDDVPVLLDIAAQVHGKPEAGAAETHPASTMPLDPLFIGLTRLAPKTGFAEIRKTIDDPKREFMHRYQAQRALRFLHEHRQFGIERASVIVAIAALLEQEDMVDLAVDDLRRFECWEYAARIVQLPEKFQAPIVRRSVLRYALSAPKDVKAAADYVLLMRVLDKEAVENAEEVMKHEKEQPVAPKVGSKP